MIRFLIKRLPAILLISTGFALSACTVSGHIVSVDEDSFIASNNKQNAMQVFIRNASDHRQFLNQEEAKDLSAPSIDQEKAQKITIGNYTNTPADPSAKRLILSDEEKLSEIITKVTNKALSNRGWNVLSDEDQISDKTNILDVDINKFWIWTESDENKITLKCEISVNLINDPLRNVPLIISTLYTKDFISIKGIEFDKEVFNALEMFRAELENKISEHPKIDVHDKDTQV